MKYLALKPQNVLQPLPANIHADISHNVQSVRTDFVDTSDTSNYGDTSVSPTSPIAPITPASVNHPILWTLVIVLVLFLFYRIYTSLTKEI